MNPAATVAVDSVRPGTRGPRPDVVVNDVHSRLNQTRVREIVRPRSIDDLRDALAGATAAGIPVAIAGGHHSMGGQQFAAGGLLLDMRSLDRVVDLDGERGLITVDAGIQWPAVAAYLHGAGSQWGIIQKQTGADRLSLGGALSCNAHGRGLRLKPIVEQVEAFDLMDAAGDIRTCSRTQHADLFRLAIGGYGLFGVITRVVLRLGIRQKVRRVVEIVTTGELMDRFDDRIRDGFVYGDFQFSIDATRSDFLRRGVFSCYQPVSRDTPLTTSPTQFSACEWQDLVVDAHVHKHRAFERYAARYLETSGQVYWSDAQLSSPYRDGYHEHVDRATGARAAGSEMITEIYVRRSQLSPFLAAAAVELRTRRANVVYGTVRLIERDDETFLAWARQPFACIVFNLHVDHTPAGIAAAADTFRALIDLGVAHDGSYYLTYHRWARPDQVAACYPQMRQFLRLKLRHDPGERFQSEWYRHHKAMWSLRP